MSRKDGKNDDLKNMLMSFRIAELQTLLASCGRSRSGRKHELLGRAVSLLKSSEGSAMRERVKSRILELYHQRYSTGNVLAGAEVAVSGIATGNMSSNYPQSYLPYSNDKDEEPTYLNRPNYQKPYTPGPRSGNYVTAMPVSNVHDQRIYEPRSAIHPASAMPIHPDVRFISLPFYDVVDVLIKPTSLVQKTMAGIQDTNLIYHLTPYQTQLITNSRSYHFKSMVEYAVQVQLRFCLAETSCVQEDLYPPRCKIIVNGKGCTLPGQPPPNAQNQEPRKPHRPVNITSFCRLSPMQSNQIQVQWVPSDLGQRYAATVHLVKIVQPEVLIQQLSNKPTRSQAHTIAFIKEKLRPDPDSEIAMTSLKVSLCCPIGRTRMVMPCRANNCNHLQCFDGSLYIQMNERKPSWVCPVCDQKAYYDDLFKDGLFTNIIAEATDCEDIVFFEDGSWRPLAEIQQGPDSSKPMSQMMPPAPKPPRVTQRLVESQSPPVLSVSTPTKPATSLAATAAPLTMPTLDMAPTSIDKEPISQPQSTTENGRNGEEDVEIITIDDSDSDAEGQPPPQKSNTAAPEVINPAQRYPSESPVSQHPSTTLPPFTDPELQGNCQNQGDSNQKLNTIGHWPEEAPSTVTVLPAEPEETNGDVDDLSDCEHLLEILDSSDTSDSDWMP